MKLTVPSLRLSHKLIAIIVVLLAFELGLLGSLHLMLEKAEAEMRSIVRAECLLINTQTLTSYFVGLGQLLIMYTASHNKAVAEQFDINAFRVNTALDNMRKLESEDPNCPKSITKIVDTARQYVDHVVKIRRLIQSEIPPSEIPSPSGLGQAGSSLTSDKPHDFGRDEGPKELSSSHRSGEGLRQELSGSPGDGQSKESEPQNRREHGRPGGSSAPGGLGSGMGSSHHRHRPRFMGSYERYFGSGRDLQPQLDSAIAEQTVRQERCLVEYQHSRTIITQCILVGVIVNIAFALLVAMLFTRGITNRLSVMNQNAFRVASAQPLLPRMIGNDEISNLDRAFHDMADSLSLLDRMKEEFLAMISHDLRIPLTAIRGTIDLLNMGAFGELSAPAKKALQGSSHQCIRMINLINQLLDLEKMQAGLFQLHIESASIKQICEESVQSVEVLAQERGVTISAQLLDATIQADQQRMVQVVVNILSNAIKFSPEGGTVTLAANPISQGVEVSISDEGRGIPQSHLETIFDRFTQVQFSDTTQLGGSGLGLAICKSIVEQHHGEIGVTSTEGQGSKFWFRLPLDAGGGRAREDIQDSLPASSKALSD